MAQIKAILAEKGGVANVETTDNKVTSLSSSSTDTQYPSAKAVYNELQDIDGANVTVTVPEEFDNPLNTNQLTAGQHDVYFTAYPDIMWHVDHVDGDYVYLGLYTITETTPFRSSGSSYSGSTVASKCTTYLNNTIPNVAQYLEDVTVEGVTAKVFIPTYYQFSGNTGYGDTSGPVFTYIANASFDTRKTIISNDWTQNPPNYGVWLSTAYNSSYVWNAYYNGSIAYGPPSGTSRTLGFRPEVKVRYKVDPVIKDLNTAIGDINTALADKQNKLTFDTAPTSGSTNPVTSDGVKIYVDSSYTIAGQKSGTTLGTKATAEGSNNTASGTCSHAEGTYTTASGTESHAEGHNTIASGNSSHAEGGHSKATGYMSHAEGSETEASGENSHAEGNYNTASGTCSHAEGISTTASGKNSHAEGTGTLASGNSSHAEGNGTTAQRKAQHVIGECNVLDTMGSTSTRGQYVEIVGNGTSASARSNARTLDWSGNETLAGKLTLGAAPTANMDAATKQYVDNSVQNIDASNVVVRYKVSSTDLNTVISDINASITKTKISGTSILGPTLYVASSDPTSSDGTDGDFWFVYEE